MFANLMQQLLTLAVRALLRSYVESVTLYAGRIDGEPYASVTVKHSDGTEEGASWKGKVDDEV